MLERVINPKAVATPKVRDVMSASPIYFAPDDNLLLAAIRMTREQIRHLPVVADGKVVGILSDRDLRVALGDPVRALEGDVDLDQTMTVGWAMTSQPVTAREDDDLAGLRRYFLDERIGALPVVDDSGALVGIVSYVDVLRYALDHVAA